MNETIIMVFFSLITFGAYWVSDRAEFTPSISILFGIAIGVSWVVCLWKNDVLETKRLDASITTGHDRNG